MVQEMKALASVVLFNDISQKKECAKMAGKAEEWR